MKAWLSFGTLSLCLSLSSCKKAPAADEAVPPVPSTATESAAAAPSADKPAQVATPVPSAAPALPAPPDVAAAPTDAKKTASGLASKILTPGKGKEHPTDTDSVLVHYTGWKKDGTMFDSSVVRGEPAKFGVTQVIPGWTEALKLMVKGEKRRIWLPAKLAYGESGPPGAPTGELVFDVELLDIAKPPVTPPDVKAAPASAKKTSSGLAYRVLSKGKGKDHPSATSRVTVHYSGWTTDGKMFDSSVARGEPARFGLNQVIKGWTEGVQLMVVGEKTRFWIPGGLAYGERPSRPGAPSGTLVFDIELITID